MVIVGEFVGGAALGAAFGLLFDVVKKAVGEPTIFKSLLGNIKFSLEFLKPVIEKIGEHNVQLGLPDEEITYLISEMEEGIKLVQKSSKVSKWSCMKSYYRDQLIELDGTLKRLFHILVVEGVRDAKETLILVRNQKDQLIETAKDAKETLVMAQQNTSRLTDSVKDGKETLELSRQNNYQLVESARDVKDTLVLTRKIKRLLKRMVPCTNKGKTRYSRNIIPKASRRSGRSQIMTFDLRVFRLTELQAATKNFSGHMFGDFGQITYKGWVDEKTLAPSKFGTGMIVTIKRYPENPTIAMKAYFLGCLSHPNLVKLLGYCFEEREKLLVYESMQRGSLSDNLSERSTDKETLSWDNRIKIAIGAARGLSFLHNIQFIYRDVKPSNILIDEDYNAKLSDSSIVMILGPTDGESEHLAGTPYYIDPEYCRTGRACLKIDVYSFGVVLLQILTGLKLSGFVLLDEQDYDLDEHRTLFNWATPLFSDGTKLETIMDEQIKGQYSCEEALKTAQLALRCVQDASDNRPSMNEVVEELEHIQAMKGEQNLSDPTMQAERFHHEVRNIDSCATRVGGISLFSEEEISTVRSKNDDQSINGHILETSNLRVFSFAELKIATRNFRGDVMIGEGGFGRVFKGLDRTGMAIAIKKLNLEGFQGFQEWQTEVNFAGRLSHPNLMKLLGYCRQDQESLIVYEFMPKGSLDNHLFRRNPNCEPLSWEKRIKIAIGAAQGLAFLHSLERQVISRGFKTSDILLDGNYNAKLSDFGIAKWGPDDGDSHVSTRIIGTLGYAAPEYIATGHLYVKSDVYSFSVVLLEILTGLRVHDTSRPKGEHNLVDWATPLLSNKRKFIKIMDVRLEGQYSLNAAFKAGQLTLKCLAPAPKDRPSMREVVEELEQIQAIQKNVLITMATIHPRRPGKTKSV